MYMYKIFALDYINLIAMFYSLTQIVRPIEVCYKHEITCFSYFTFILI